MRSAFLNCLYWQRVGRCFWGTMLPPPPPPSHPSVLIPSPCAVHAVRTCSLTPGEVVTIPLELTNKSRAPASFNFQGRLACVSNQLICKPFDARMDPQGSAASTSINYLVTALFCCGRSAAGAIRQPRVWGGAPHVHSAGVSHSASRAGGWGVRVVR